MRITLESTREIVEIVPPGAEPGSLGTPHRVWIGRTEAGTPIRALIAVVGVERTDDQEPFERELDEKFPTVDGPRVFPSRLVL